MEVDSKKVIDALLEQLKTANYDKAILTAQVQTLSDIITSQNATQPDDSLDGESPF